MTHGGENLYCCSCLYICVYYYYLQVNLKKKHVGLSEIITQKSMETRDGHCSRHEHSIYLSILFDFFFTYTAVTCILVVNQIFVV